MNKKRKSKRGVTSTYLKTWRKDHPDYAYEQVKKYRKSHPEQTALDLARQRSRKFGRVCSLTLKDLPLIPEHCPIFPWLKLTWHVGEGVGRKDDSPSLDRIDNTKGYEPGNVRWISWRANRLKADASKQELEALVQAIQ